MWVVGQNRDEVANIGIAESVRRYGNNISSYREGSFHIRLGTYETEERAKEVFEELLRSLFPPACIVLKNGSLPDGFAEDAQKLNVPVMVTKTDDGVCDTKVIENKVYYMPES